MLVYITHIKAVKMIINNKHVRRVCASSIQYDVNNLNSQLAFSTK